MAFTLTKEIQAYLREKASQEDRSISAIVRRIILEEMERENNGGDNNEIRTD